MYLALLTQDGGRDYTIACGLKWVELAALTDETALHELRRYLVENNLLIGEMALARVKLIKVSGSVDVPLDAWADEMRDERDRKEDLEEEAEERREFERLKAKFEKGGCADG